MELQCAVQNYAWGKIGLSGAVAALRANADPSFSVDENGPYAELWMGTHPNGPSSVKETGESLQAHLASNPAALGLESRKIFGDDLPFLFKVLSVNKALSIQAHPNKDHAEMLHRERPDVYKDPNHKPEMAIALTPFEGLCGFRPLEEIKRFFQNIPELRSVIGADLCNNLVGATDDNYQPSLKAAFEGLMLASKDVIKEKLSKLESTIQDKAEKDSTDTLFLRLCQQYPGDVGCFVLFFVNHVTLAPGEAMFLEPNLIHAYLAGDCIECMACSDNVVRAGLTPKLIDVPTLCEMLQYRCVSGPQMKFEPTKESQETTLYKPSVPDFAVAKHVVPGGTNVPIKKRASASIVLVIEGEGSFSEAGASSVNMKRGQAFFLKAGDEIIVGNTDGKEDVLLFQAFC